MTTERVEPPARRVRVMCCIGSLGGGGAERQVLEILRRLDRTRFEPRLYLTYRAGELLSELPADVPLGCYAEAGGPTGWRRWLARARLMWWDRRKHLTEVLRRDRPDVVYSRTFLASCDADVACAAAGVPHVIAAVADPQTELNLHARRFRHWFHQRARRMYRRAAAVLANSRGLADRLESFFDLPAGSVAVQRNLADFSAMRDRAAEGSAPWTLDAGESRPFDLLTVGRVDANKGQMLLLEALRAVRNRRPELNWRWHVLGQGPDMRTLGLQAYEWRLSDRVKCHGFVANPFPAYAAADLFVLPSYSEGSPNALLEAMTCGTPALSTDCPSGPRELLDGGRRGGLVRVGSAGHLADAIIDFITNPQPWRDRARMAQAELEAEYDVAVNLPRLEDRLVEAARDQS